MTLSERSNASKPLLATSPERLPVVPPLPTCSVPAPMMVPPPYVLALFSTSVPASVFVNAPAPPIAPFIVSVWPASTSIVPPLAVSVVPRAVVNVPVASSVPPSKLSPPVAAPRLPSLATLNMPPLMAVPPL
ncbi:hypothetical protein DP49_5682 [Burkholderia pseudomallei]|nr:hypothetical protein DP49_5682 [Burkholderia pseudomallei]